MDTQLPELTVGRLIEDLSRYELDAQVSVSIMGLPVTIPIMHMLHAEVEMTGADNNYVLLLIRPDHIQNALSVCREAKNDEKLPSLN